MRFLTRLRVLLRQGLQNWLIESYATHGVTQRRPFAVPHLVEDAAWTEDLQLRSLSIPTSCRSAPLRPFSSPYRLFTTKSDDSESSDEPPTIRDDSDASDEPPSPASLPSDDEWTVFDDGNAQVSSFRSVTLFGMQGSFRKMQKSRLLLRKCNLYREKRGTL